VLEEIALLETASVEFKSSLEVDRRRISKDPGRKASEYRSENVLMSALKTIAAFANSGGGTLYLGVEDNGNICGLSEDFAAINPDKGDYDGWDLHLRNLIRSRFNDGAALNAYVKTQRYEKEGLCFVQVKIAPRQRLTFLRKGDVWELFIRSGTQTTAIPYCEIEHHFTLIPLY
jgi:predicted HTH transcriptional regulator